VCIKTKSAGSDSIRKFNKLTLEMTPVCVFIANQYAVRCALT